MEPNTTLILMQNIKLDKNYTNTIYFPSELDQQNWFKSKAHWTFTNSQYRRKNGVVRVEGNAFLYENDNYIMWMNENFTVRWFYAFIDRVEYVNDNATDIYFTLDYMQSYFPFFQYDYCFVEREHVMNDGIGNNLLPEPVILDRIICVEEKKLQTFDRYEAILWYAEAEQGGIDNHFISGLYQGFKLQHVPMEQNMSAVITNTINKLLENNDFEAITAISTMPSEYFSDTGQPKSITIGFEGIDQDTTLDGYKPHNNKLLSYPYYYFVIDSLNATAVYRYEYFDQTNYLTFRITGVTCPAPEVILEPIGYNGSGESNPNFTERIVLSGFPQLPCVGDSYKAYLAQSGFGSINTPFGSYAVSDLVQTGASALTSALTYMKSENPLVLGLGFASAFNTAKDVDEKAKAPDLSTGGGGGTLTSAVATKNCGFYLKRMSLTNEQARIADRFFDMFGYNVSTVKIPNTHGRPHWNYVKTSTCNISGEIPAVAVEMIKNITNKGITFWRNGDEIGNYSLNNK